MDLFRAAMAGDAPRLRELLAQLPDVDARDNLGNTALMLAVSAGQTDAVEALLAAGADLEKRDSVGRTAIVAAAGCGHVQVVRLLLARGAKLDARDCLKGTVLHAAVRGDRQEVVRVLLEAGADPNASQPALFEAVVLGRDEITRLLLEGGADPNPTLPHGWRRFGPLQAPPAGTTPLHLAARDGNSRIVELLLAAGADVAARDASGSTPLEQAANNGHVAVVKRLRAGEAPGTIDAVRYHTQALARGADAGDLASVQEALAADAEIEGPTPSRTTPLQSASRGGHAAVVRALLAAGADPSRRSRGSGTPLGAAVAGGHEEVVRLLLDAGADVHAAPVPESFGFIYEDYPLLIALKRGNRALVDLLLAAEADVNYTALDGLTPLMAAVICRRFDLAHRLLAAGAVPRPENADFLALMHFSEAASEPAFRDCVAKIATLCGVAPERLPAIPGAVTFRLDLASRPEQPVGPSKVNRDVVGLSPQLLGDHPTRASEASALIDQATAAARSGGYLLLDAHTPVGCVPTTRFLVLLPTMDKFAVLAAFGVHDNEAERSTREIIAWFREVDCSAPFELRACGHNTVEIEFTSPVQDAVGLAGQMCTFCPELYQAYASFDELVNHLRAGGRVRFRWP